MSLQSILDTPWKLSNEAWRWLAYPFVRLSFIMNGIIWGQGWRIYGMPVLQKHRRSYMHFGEGLSLRSSLRSNPLGPTHPVILSTWKAGACLEIGSNFAMSGGSICAAKSITIGDNVNIGANSTIVDTDFHPLNANLRRLNPADGLSAPVVIQDFVFIGMNCTILKGVTIGQGSVIGAGSVVSRDLPANVIAAGNPARVIREI